MYINLGLGTDGPDNGPQNFSFPMVPVFQITGPSKGPYPGEFCLPQVPLPANVTVSKGDKATIQVVEVAVHGASLFNVSQPSSIDLLESLEWDAIRSRGDELKGERRAS